MVQPGHIWGLDIGRSHPAIRGSRQKLRPARSEGCSKLPSMLSTARSMFSRSIGAKADLSPALILRKMERPVPERYSYKLETSVSTQAAEARHSRALAP